MFIHINNCLKKRGVGRFCGLLVFLLLGMTMDGCRKEVQPERLTNYTGKSYSEVFEAYWNGMNTNYVFWDIDTVVWNSKYKTYKPLFESLDGQQRDSTTEAKAVQYIVDMSIDLADSHMNLTFNDTVIYVVGGHEFRSRSFSPSKVRYLLRGGHPAIPRKVFDTIIYNNYLTNAEHGIGQLTIEGETGTVRVNVGIIPQNNKKILYLEYPVFLLKMLYDDPSTSNSVKIVFDHFFGYTKDPTIDGLIIDLRSNSGGMNADLDFLLGRLITDPVHFYYTRYKNGAGRLDYTPWIKGYVHPQSGGTNFTKPIAVLVDNYSLSMAELTSMAAKAIFPKAKLVGERTWGGNGTIEPDDDVQFLGGVFTAANFVSVFMATFESRDKNLISYENIGLPPDIPIAYDSTAIKNNIDVQLDKAIEYITQ